MTDETLKKQIEEIVCDAFLGVEGGTNEIKHVLANHVDRLLTLIHQREEEARRSLFPLQVDKDGHVLLGKTTQQQIDHIERMLDALTPPTEQP